MARRIDPLPLFPIDPPQGFDAEKLRTVKANGSPFVQAPGSPATVPVPVPVILADVLGKYTERDRKLWRFLIHAAWDDLDTKRRHSLPMREVAKVFEDITGAKDHDWIKDSAKRLFDLRVNYKITCGDPRFSASPDEAGEGMTRFLSGVHFSEMGTLTYEIPAMLIDIIKKPLRFARLRTHFILGLSGKHAVTIYEILESFTNKYDPSFVVSIDEIRRWLSIKDEKYSDWRDLNKRVIKPAIDQINENPEGAGFSVEMETIKRGRDITHLKFVMTKAEQRRTADHQLQRSASDSDWLKRHADAPRLSAGTLQKAARTHPRADIHAVHREWVEHWTRSGKKALKSPDGAFLKFAATWAKRRHL